MKGGATPPPGAPGSSGAPNGPRAIHHPPADHYRASPCASLAMLGHHPPPPSAMPTGPHGSMFVPVPMIPAQMVMGMNRMEPPRLRKGKWTPEEEEYSLSIIYHFTMGSLKLAEGTTLRAYLAEKLNCDPMRITKKFTGGSCLGKRVYHGCKEDSEYSEEVEKELGALEAKFLARIAEIPEEAWFAHARGQFGMWGKQNHGGGPGGPNIAILPSMRPHATLYRPPGAPMDMAAWQRVGPNSTGMAEVPYGAAAMGAPWANQMAVLYRQFPNGQMVQSVPMHMMQPQPQQNQRAQGVQPGYPMASLPSNMYSPGGGIDQGGPTSPPPPGEHVTVHPQMGWTFVPTTSHPQVFAQAEHQQPHQHQLQQNPPPQQYRATDSAPTGGGGGGGAHHQHRKQLTSNSVGKAAQQQLQGGFTERPSSSAVGPPATPAALYREVTAAALRSASSPRLAPSNEAATSRGSSVATSSTNSDSYGGRKRKAISATSSQGDGDNKSGTSFSSNTSDSSEGDISGSTTSSSHTVTDVATSRLPKATVTISSSTPAGAAQDPQKATVAHRPVASVPPPARPSTPAANVSASHKKRRLTSARGEAGTTSSDDGSNGGMATTASESSGKSAEQDSDNNSAEDACAQSAVGHSAAYEAGVAQSLSLLSAAARYRSPNKVSTSAAAKMNSRRQRPSPRPHHQHQAKAVFSPSGEQTGMAEER